MYNGEVEYAKMFKDMENEVLALKTAHQRPLGALNFFKESVDLNITLNYSLGSYYRAFRVVVVIGEPVSKPPIVQPFWDTPVGFSNVWLSNSSIDSGYTTYTYEMYLINDSISSTSFKFGVLSSQPIENITWSYL